MQDKMIETNKVEYKAKLNKQFASNLELLTPDGIYNYVSYLMADSNGTSIKVAKYKGLNKVNLIFQGYSNPNNREIMRIFKELDMVEHLGSGMHRILSHYKKENFILNDIFLRVVFVSNYDEIDGVSIGGQIKLTQRQEDIIKLIQKNIMISHRDITNILAINDSAVKKYLNNLKEKGILRRIGGTRGYWQVNDAK